MNRLIPIAVAAIVLCFGAGSATADSATADKAGTQSWQGLSTQSSQTITFTEGWFKHEVLELGYKCKKRCKKKCKRKYKKCKRKYAKKYCKHKKRKCKRKCKRRCRY